MESLMNYRYFSPYIRVYRVGRIRHFVDGLLSRLKNEISVSHGDQSDNSHVNSEILLLMREIDWEHDKTSLYNQLGLRQPSKDNEPLSLSWEEYSKLAD